jgi:DNA-binding PadR family transcriptional regulator
MLDRHMALLGCALLALLYQAPRSGYDLRKIFSYHSAATFSDSPSDRSVQLSTGA